MPWSSAHRDVFHVDVDEDDQFSRLGCAHQTDHLRHCSQCPRLDTIISHCWRHAGFPVRPQAILHDLITQTSCGGAQLLYSCLPLVVDQTQVGPSVWANREHPRVPCLTVLHSCLRSYFGSVLGVPRFRLALARDACFH